MNNGLSGAQAAVVEQPAGDTRRVPRLGLGLPVYNAAQFLRECLDSILGQTFSDFELVVCDNASTDDTVQIIEEYMRRDPRISLHRAASNQGAAANFNWAFRLSRCEYFKWCAGDDVLEPDFLERCMQALESDADAVLAYSGAVDIDENSSRLREIYDNRVPLRFGAPEVHVRFLDLVSYGHSCIAVFGVVRRKDLETTSMIGPYVGSDRTTLVELGLRGKLLRIGDDRLLHREHRGRSVNEIKDLRRRAVWFDSNARGRIYPNWRLLAEYFRAVRVSRASFAEKMRCYVQLAKWIKWGYWRDLYEDLAYYLRPGNRPSNAASK